MLHGKAENKRGVRGTAALLVSLMILFASPVLAQQYFDPGLLQKSIESKPEEYQPPGARLGSFMLLPGVEAAWVHSDNVFYLPEDEISDDAFLIRPFANLTSDWNRHAVNLSAWADIARHDKYSENDYEDWGVRADGRIDVLQNSWFSWDASYLHLHEDRRDPNAGAPASPTEFDYDGFGFGYDHIFNRLKIGAYYNHNTFGYDNNVTGEGELIDNGFRDRSQDRLTLRGDYQIGPETAVFASYGVNEVEYDISPDPNGFFRDSDGYSLSAGVSWDISDMLRGDLSANWANQSYDDPELFDVEGFSLGAGLTWTPRQTTVVTFRMAGSPQETTQDGTSGYFSRLYSVRLQQEIKPNLLFNARASYTDNDYENAGLDDGELSNTEVLRYGAGLTYLFNRNVYASAGYTFETQDSNLGRFNYDVNRFFVSVGLEF